VDKTREATIRPAEFGGFRKKIGHERWGARGLAWGDQTGVRTGVGSSVGVIKGAGDESVGGGKVSLGGLCCAERVVLWDVGAWVARGLVGSVERFFWRADTEGVLVITILSLSVRRVGCVLLVRRGRRGGWGMSE